MNVLHVCVCLLFYYNYCNESYTLVGDHERKCLSSGIWSSVTPICTGELLGETMPVPCICSSVSALFTI